MLEQFFLLLALLVCLLLVGRLLAGKKATSCHSGQCDCEEAAPVVQLTKSAIEKQ